MLKGYIHQYRKRFKTFADVRITQYMRRVACIYVVVPQ